LAEALTPATPTTAPTASTASPAPPPQVDDHKAIDLRLPSILAGLDRAETEQPGHGKVDLFAFAERDRQGAGLDVTHRINQRWAAFGQGWVARERSDREAGREAGRLGYGVMGGLRLRW